MARALLLEKQLHRTDAAQRLQHYRPKLAAAAHCMLRPEVLKRGLKSNEPFTHRRWPVAAAWGLAGQVTDDAELPAAAARIAAQGIALQQPDGVNPEKRGFDVSYQAVGLLLAARYSTVCDDAALRGSIATMLSRGLNRELLSIGPEGQIDATGSTRVTSETSRSGAGKTVDNKAVLGALLYGARLLKRSEYAHVAERVARRLNWIKD